MSCRIVHLTTEPEFVGRAVCAIGVFDGVHLGHQALVRHAVSLAENRGVECFVITFDRDPDQVVTPDSAAPQLLTLADKAQFLCDAGADAVLVVPFDEHVASLEPTEFLTEILLSAVDPVAVVVGSDFRFGHRASGTVETLTRFGEPRGIRVVAHDLVAHAGEPVTSTRIRALIAAGDVEAAAGLLGRPHRVTGQVVRGRGEGTSIGVPTANIVPAPFAALPAAGVYAGRVVVANQSWPAAISVGRPPTFPQATDVLEAHLIGFEGDLYDAQAGIEFLARLREQRRFDSLPELLAAMRADIDTAAQIAGEPRLIGPTGVDAEDAEPQDGDDWELNPVAGLADAFFDVITMGATDAPELLEDGSPIVEDPDALEAAERAVAELDTSNAYADFDETWVRVLGPSTLGSLLTAGGVTAFMVTSPLAAASIPFVWQPFPPEDQQNVRPDFNFWTGFSLWVPPEYAREAAALLGVELSGT